ncbi:MAG: STAS domain-containing protein [Planctomycetota bacterium]
MAVRSGEDTIDLRSEGAVVVATIRKGTFRDEKQILPTLERLGKIIDARSKVQMVLDLSHVEYLSSAGLGRLVALLKKARAGGGDLYLAAVNKPIHELLEVMRLTEIFEIHGRIEEAVEAFGG